MKEMIFAGVLKELSLKKEGKSIVYRLVFVPDAEYSVSRKDKDNTVSCAVFQPVTKGGGNGRVLLYQDGLVLDCMSDASKMLAIGCHYEFTIAKKSSLSVFDFVVSSKERFSVLKIRAL